jgi:hypothetical protein
MMQNNPANSKRLKQIQQLLYQHLNRGQGVCDMAKSITSYDGGSALRYIELAIATCHVSPLYSQEKTASRHAIAC